MVRKFGCRIAVNEGDVLLAWSGTPGTSFGAHMWRGPRGVLNQHIFRVDIDTARVYAPWAVIAINGQLDQMIGKAHGGVGLRHVTKGEVERLQVLLPPIEEQKRIAAILNEQMKVVERARAAMETQLRAANLLRSAYLRLVFDNTRSQDWPKHTVGSLSSLIIDGPHVTPEYVTEGIPFLTVRNIVKRRIDLSEVSYISQDNHRTFSRRGRAEPGDILYTKDGTLGVPCLVDIDRDFSFFVSVALIKPIRDKICPAFLALALDSPDVREQVQLMGAGAGLKHMVLKSIRALQVPVPKIEDQKRIAAEFQSREQVTGEIKAALTEQLNEIKKAPLSLLRRAFNGEL